MRNDDNLQQNKMWNKKYKIYKLQQKLCVWKKNVVSMLNAFKAGSFLHEFWSSWPLVIKLCAERSECLP